MGVMFDSTVLHQHYYGSQHYNESSAYLTGRNDKAYSLHVPAMKCIV